MSMLLASKDIYLSTQQSGAPGTNDQRFSRFRMSLNTTPLVCGTNEQTRLSVTQFNCPKVHYDINQHNNRVDVIFDHTNSFRNGQATDTFRKSTFNLTRNNYATFTSIATAFKDGLQQRLRSVLDEDGLEIFINEITYVGEVERVTIANPNQKDLIGYKVALYAENATEITTSTLEESTTAQFKTIVISTLGRGLPKAVALVNNDDQVVQFLSINGQITATNGEANGETSVSIATVDDDEAGQYHFSLQLRGTGFYYDSFFWSDHTAAEEVTDQQNPNQKFVDPNTLGVTAEVSSDHILRFDITGAAVEYITNLVIQTPQRKESNLPELQSDSPSFNDSYIILGGKRITQEVTADSTTTDLKNSFTITPSGNGTEESPYEISVSGFYPMQKVSMPYIYLTCSEAGGNLESQNLGSAENQDEHMVSSQIVCKIPVGSEFCRYQATSSNCPYFSTTSNRHISEMVFTIRDHHGRPLPVSDPTIETEGSLFSDMTLKADTYATGGSTHTLDTPFPKVPDPTVNQIKAINGVLGNRMKY